MKKIITAVLLVIFLMTAVAESAIDYKSLTDEELQTILKGVSEEIVERKNSLVYEFEPGVYFVGADLIPGKYSIYFYEAIPGSTEQYPQGFYNVWNSYEESMNQLKYRKKCGGAILVDENFNTEADFIDLSEGNMIVITKAKARLIFIMK